MAESDEHKFLSASAVDFLDRAAGTRLYAFAESERRKFDFGCSLTRDWTRPLVGQTLWKHIEGADKDLRTMLTDSDADLCLYIAQDTMRARRIVHEAIGDFRKVGIPVEKLKIVWVPSDFDSDDETQREQIRALLEERLASDLLLNVVLGNLNPEAVGLFNASTGAIGLDLAVLARVATHGFFNLSSLARVLGVSTASLRERLTRLTGCGFLTQPDGGSSFWYVSLRGRVFLELCNEVQQTAGLAPELELILDLLALRSTDPTRQDGLGSLLARVAAARRDFDVDLADLSYHRYWEGDGWPPHLPRPEPWR